MLRRSSSVFGRLVPPLQKQQARSYKEFEEQVGFALFCGAAQPLLRGLFLALRLEPDRCCNFACRLRSAFMPNAATCAEILGVSVCWLLVAFATVPTSCRAQACEAPRRKIVFELGCTAGWELIVAVEWWLLHPQQCAMSGGSLTPPVQESGQAMDSIMFSNRGGKVNSPSGFFWSGWVTDATYATACRYEYLWKFNCSDRFCFYSFHSYVMEGFRLQIYSSCEWLSVFWYVLTPSPSPSSSPSPSPPPSSSPPPQVR
jgi:hypothetical protein